MRALTRMLVSRTTRRRRAHLLVDQVENVLLVAFGVAFLDLPDGQIEYAPAHGFVDEPGQGSLLAAAAGEERADHATSDDPVGQSPADGRLEKRRSAGAKGACAARDCPLSR